MCIFYVCKSNWLTLQKIQDIQHVENIIRKCGFLYFIPLHYLILEKDSSLEDIFSLFSSLKKKSDKQNLSLIFLLWSKLFEPYEVYLIIYPMFWGALKWYSCCQREKKSGNIWKPRSAAHVCSLVGCAFL